MTALEEIKKAEHERIWLEPAGAPDRCWCQDNQWGDEGVEYVLASTLESLKRENEELRHNLKKCVEYMTCFTRLSNGEDEANHRKAITETARKALASTGGEHAE